MSTIITNQGIVRVDYNALTHWAKGSEAKNHKWIKRIWTGKGWRYQYKQASNKAKHLGNKIEDSEYRADRKETLDETMKEYRQHLGKSRIYKKAYELEEKRHGKGSLNNDYNAAVEKGNAAQSARYYKEVSNDVNSNIREKEDAKRQQSSAIGAANRAKSKSAKSKAMKAIKKLKKIKNGDFVLYSEKEKIMQPGSERLGTKPKTTTLSITDTYANGKKKVRYKKRSK